MLASVTVWSYHSYWSDRSVAAVERSFSLMQALLIVGMLFAASYYGVPLGRHAHGIAMGFGIWASLATANYAIYDTMPSFLPYWQVVRPLSFVALLGFWTFVFWKDAPELRLAEHSVPASELSAWTEEWNRVLSLVRRIKSS
jgi:hypothetical protein